MAEDGAGAHERDELDQEEEQNGLADDGGLLPDASHGEGGASGSAVGTGTRGDTRNQDISQGTKSGGRDEGDAQQGLSSGQYGKLGSEELAGSGGTGQGGTGQGGG